MTDTAFQRSFLPVKSIDADIEARRRAVQAAYEEEMAPLRAEFQRRQKSADDRRKATLKELDRHRREMMRLAGAMPVARSTVAAVKRVTADGSSVSLPRVSCLEKAD